MEKKDSFNNYHMDIIDNYNFCDRHIRKQTLPLYDRPGPEGQDGEKEEEEKPVWYGIE